jgi:hypothetical protein
MQFPLSNREFLIRSRCFATPDSLVLVFYPLPAATTVDYGCNTRSVRARSWGVLRLKPVAALAGRGSQCHVTITQHVDAGGFIPKRIVDSRIALVLRPVNDMRAAFQRDEEVTKNEIAMKAFVMTDSHQTYDAGELDLMARVKAKFAAAGTATFVALESPDKLVSMFSAASVGNVRATVMARTVVDAPFSQAAAWEVLKGSGRKHVKNHSSNGGLGLNAVQVNEHMNVVRAVYSVPVPGSRPREWVQLQIWKRASNAREITVIYHNTEHNRFPIRREYVRTIASARERKGDVSWGASEGRTPTSRALSRHASAKETFVGARAKVAPQRRARFPARSARAKRRRLRLLGCERRRLLPSRPLRSCKRRKLRLLGCERRRLLPSRPLRS